MCDSHTHTCRRTSLFTSQLRLRTQAWRTTLKSCGCLGCWWLRKRIPVSSSMLTKPGWDAGRDRHPYEVTSTKRGSFRSKYLMSLWSHHASCSPPSNHLTHFSSLCGWAVGSHSQSFTFPITISVPVPRCWDPRLGWRGRGWRVQCLGAEQCPRAMELTEVTESNQSIHLQKSKVIHTLCLLYLKCLCWIYVKSSS